MMNQYYRLAMLLLVVGFTSCQSKEDEIDTQPPVIDMAFADAFPQQCEVLQRGETYSIVALFTDNSRLGSYSLDIHHNFDHHTHDDQGTQCELDAVKSAINPMILMENRPVEGGPRSFEIEISVAIPLVVDPGDYHCAFSVTDRNGWQGRTSVDIKIH